MSLEPLIVGSIKDLVVCSVWALGELATKARLHKAVDSNDAVISIAINTLVRDGYMRPHQAGHYVLADELAATLKPADRTPIAAAAIPSEAPTMAKKTCTECSQTKNESEFYAGNAKCKPCFLKRQRASKAAKNGKAPAPPKHERALAPPSGDEFVIPAAGQIHCRVLDAGAGPSFVLQQGNDQVICSVEQLQILRDWASGVIKKASAA